MTELSFIVRGRPVAQGNAKAFVVGKRAVVVTGAGKGPLADWRQAIAEEARQVAGSRPVLTGPVMVVARFVVQRPRSHYLPANRRRPEPVLRLDAPKYSIAKPDADKLARALLDAITSVLIRDDSQVASLQAVKVYETDDLREGVHVRLATLEETR
jgi:crossover junction endodeoxyribonuclease RusA